VNVQASENLPIPVHVRIQTANNVVVGFVHVPTTGYRRRVSDLLNQEGFDFLPVTQARVYSLDGSETLGTEECLIVNKRIIQTLVPQESGPAH
jgi:hypothetical protein